MKIYTKTGDAGQTALANGDRVLKSHLRVCAYGEIDELGAHLGLAVTYVLNKKFKKELLTIQKELMALGSLVANPNDKKNKSTKLNLTGRSITRLEKQIDKMNEILPPLTNFILSGGSVLASLIHIARTTCRKAERTCVDLYQIEKLNPLYIKYLNRLSDYLFVAARYANYLNCEDDVVWD